MLCYNSVLPNSGCVNDLTCTHMCTDPHACMFHMRVIVILLSYIWRMCVCVLYVGAFNHVISEVLQSKKAAAYTVLFGDLSIV